MRKFVTVILCLIATFIIILPFQMKKETRGGAREGAGRPKTKEDTVVMRIPKSLVPAVKKLINAKK